MDRIASLAPGSDNYAPTPRLALVLGAIVAVVAVVVIGPAITVFVFRL